MSSSDLISLDWRNAPSTADIIERIYRLFSDLDQHAEVNLCLSSSTAKGAVSLVAQEDGTAMLRRHHNVTKRKFNPATCRQYFHPLWEIAETLISMQVKKQAFKSRFIAYKDVEPSLGMKLQSVKRLMLDLALTIKVHPIALGVKGEASGQVSVPRNCKIQATCVANVFDYNDRHKNPGKDFRSGARMTTGLHSIPEPVLSLKVTMSTQTKPPGRIDAVLVVEHRNLSELLLEQTFAVENVIVVMTAGFPDSATKEFLHLLSVNDRTRHLPFLYFGDHDTPGYSIFQCLKYGSRTSAWVSPISVCPQLRYVGPTVRDLKQSPVVFRPKWIAQYRFDLPHATNAQVEKAADTWQSQSTRKVEGKLTHLTKKDKQTLTCFERLGWLQYEPLIRQEITLMKEGNGVFRFANLAQASTDYVRQFIEPKVREHCLNRVAVSQTAVPTGSPTTQGFRAMSSQSTRVGLQDNADSQANVGSTDLTEAAESLTLEANLENAMVSMY